MDRFNLTHTYDALNRLTGTTGDQGYRAHSYSYDSLGNLVYEQIHNKGNEYWYDSLNQQVRKVMEGRDTYVNTFDNRGNLVQEVYQRNQNHSNVVEAYVYDATNRMVSGTNEDGEESRYIFNGLGHLVANELSFNNNGYGYHGNEVRKDYVIDYTSPLANVIMEYESGDSALTYRYAYGLQAVTGFLNCVELLRQKKLLRFFLCCLKALKIDLAIQDQGIDYCTTVSIIIIKKPI